MNMEEKAIEEMLERIMQVCQLLTSGSREESISPNDEIRHEDHSVGHIPGVDPLLPS